MATVIAIAKAFRWHRPKERYKLVVYVDGLSKSKREYCRRQLRDLGVSPQKVQGVRSDESNALTRLADMVAGFLRDAMAGKSKEAVSLYERGKRQRRLIEV